MDTKDQIKQYISIVDVATLYVNLKPAGKNFKSLCPFHAEKTPSFFVMPERNTFTCFGCNRFGDIFTLVQEMEHIGFVEAIHFLAEKFNIPLEKNQRQGIKKDVYFQINDLAQRFFLDCLWNTAEGQKAQAYLGGRGLEKKTLELFAVGYAPDRWDGLLQHLQRQGADLEKTVELGLLVRNENNRMYDRFRSRVIFPICSESGAIIAFGGRTVLDNQAKYLNSPDTPVYKKGNHLYGFNLAKEAMRDKKAAILVEGYLDLISLHQAGIRHAVASLGTALTEKQIYLLKRFAQDIYLFLDSDSAGQTATLRGIEKMFEQNISPMIIRNNLAKDPDELIQKQGVQAFYRLLEEAQEGFKFLLDSATAGQDLSKPERKRAAVESVLAPIKKISDSLIREEYLQMTAHYFKVDPVLLKLEAQTPAAAAGPAGGTEPRLSAAERIFLEAVLAYPELLAEVKEFFSEESLSTLTGRNIIECLMATYARHGELRFQEATQLLSDGERKLLGAIFAAAASTVAERAEVEKRLAASVLNFQERLHKKKLREINREIALSEKENDMARVKQLLAKKNEARSINEQGHARRSGLSKTHKTDKKKKASAQKTSAGKNKTAHRPKLRPPAKKPNIVKKANTARNAAAARAPLPRPVPEAKEVGVSAVLLKTLVEQAKAGDGRLKYEAFIRFLKENDILDRKQEVLAHLASLAIKVLQRKPLGSQQRLEEYERFCEEFKKELRAILARAKKNFGLIENAQIHYVFGADDIIKKNVKFIKHFLKREQVKIVKTPPKKKPAKAAGERSEIVGDPVRQYLREMGSVNLLSRNEEISIARKIERGEKKVIKALSKTNIVLNRLSSWAAMCSRASRTSMR